MNEMLRREPWLDAEVRQDARMALQTAHLANLLAPRKDKQPWSMDDFLPKWKKAVSEPASPQDLRGKVGLMIQAGYGKMVH